MPRVCKTDPNLFCYICGQFMTRKQRRTLTPATKESYEYYFSLKIINFDKSWTPNFCCNHCTSNLFLWRRGQRPSMSFGTPMIWKEPIDHFTNCYFCSINTSGYSGKNKCKIEYPNVSSVTYPQNHSELLPVPKLAQEDDLVTDKCTYLQSVDGCKEPEEMSDSECFDTISDQPILINQSKLNDLFRDLKLSKLQSELLGSRLKEWNMLEPGTFITHVRKRQRNLESYFSMSGELVYCNDVDGLMMELGREHKPCEWRLFIDASKDSLKAVLLFNGNLYPSVPVAHAAKMKETYENMKVLLDCVNYSNYKWQICADLKVVAIVLGLQTGYTKFCCFLCEWDSRARDKHYKVKAWPKRKEFIPGAKNVSSKPLVGSNDIILPPLHIKLGLMKNFVKAMDKTGKGFLHLKEKFKYLSDAKLKEGIFVGPEIRQVLKDEEFQKKLTAKEKAAWISFKEVCANFLGSRRSDKYKTLVANMLKNYFEAVTHCNHL